MRLFIAINLADEIKNSLCKVMNGLKQRAVRGNFTRCENLHLTLVFLGELPSEQVEKIGQIMDSIREKPFALTLSGYGKFSDILWIGVEKNDALLRLQKALSKELASAGFRIERREFKPHLTLCRGAVLPEGFEWQASPEPAGEMRMEVSHIDLMKSERINGRLVYTPVCTTTLPINGD